MALSLFPSDFKTLRLVVLTSSWAVSSCISVGCSETNAVFRSSASFCSDMKMTLSFASSGQFVMVLAMNLSWLRFLALSALF
eukprot:12288181-Heterocapsa_arctica.AAC.1